VKILRDRGRSRILHNPEERFSDKCSDQIKTLPGSMLHLLLQPPTLLRLLLLKTVKGSGIMGVIDGFSPRGVETPEDKAHSKEFLRKIGYKLIGVQAMNIPN